MTSGGQAYTGGELLHFIWREVIEGIDMFRLHFRKGILIPLSPSSQLSPCYQQNDLQDTGNRLAQESSQGVGSDWGGPGFSE